MKENKINLNGYIYVYNPKQAYFYIRNGVDPVIVDKNPNSGNIFFKFKKRDTNSLYGEWMSLNKK